MFFIEYDDIFTETKPMPCDFTLYQRPAPLKFEFFDKSHTLWQWLYKIGNYFAVQD